MFYKWLNFINENDHIKQSTIFAKFISNNNFDEDFFTEYKTPYNDFPFSKKISETVTQKFFNAFSNFYF